MRLLIVTQKVDENDAILGFFHGWIAEFAKHCTNVIVICLEERVHHLPENVKVLSLGKEKRHSRFQYLFRFYRYIWQERKNYDAVFVHMNPEYVVLGGLPWKCFGKKIALWYTHKSVDIKLRIAEKITNKIFTASKESFRLESKKMSVMGHGIDTKLFSLTDIPTAEEKIVLSVGRISPTKRQLDIVSAFAYVQKEVSTAVLHIAGRPTRKEDVRYLERIREYIKEQKLEERVRFLDAIPNKKMPPIYQEAAVVVNMSETGSIDKDVLEALSCGIPALTTNSAFKGIIPDELIRNDGDAMVEKIVDLLKEMPSREKRAGYREIVTRNHSLDRLISNLVSDIQIV